MMDNYQVVNNRKARRDAAKGKGVTKPVTVTKREITPEERARRNHKNVIAKASRKANRGK